MARLARIPLLEPSNPQEVKDLIKYGLNISEQFEIPLLIRTTTRISHMRGIVNLGKIIAVKKKGFFKKDPSKYVVVPQFVVQMRKRLQEKITQIQKITEETNLNKIIDTGGKELGIISSGAAFNYVIDVVQEMGLKTRILKLAFSYPFPEQTVLDFINTVDKVLIVEEVEPVMEQGVLAILGRYSINKRVYGKLDETLPLMYEFNPDIVSSGIEKMINGKLRERKQLKTNLPLPLRPPVLCPGCPHRPAYYALKRAIRKLRLKEEDIIYSSDIGCYALALQPPYNMADYCICMGSSLGIGSGFAKTTSQRVIAFIGDSTFFHAGMPGLVNAIHHKEKLLLVVMDNRTTGMTGGQPHPGIPIDGQGNPAQEISIEEVARGMGAGLVKTIDPFSLKEAEEVFIEALQFEEVAVIITKHPCAMIINAVGNKKGEKKPGYKINQEKCNCCLLCVNSFTCPAFFVAKDNSVNINSLLCNGCGVCVQVCPKKAIEVIK